MNFWTVKHLDLNKIPPEEDTDCFDKVFLKTISSFISYKKDISNTSTYKFTA